MRSRTPRFASTRFSDSELLVTQASPLTLMTQNSTRELNSEREASPAGVSLRWIRIIPVALIMYTIAFIDRTNISFAFPHISRDLHLDPQQAGTVAGIF